MKELLKKTAYYLVSTPIVVALSYFLASILSSAFNGSGAYEKLFSNELHWIIIGVFMHLILDVGIVYVLYLFARKDKFLRIVAMASIVLSVLFHIFTS